MTTCISQRPAGPGVSPPAGSAPSIVTQPSNITVAINNPFTLSVVASGTPTLTYQWQKFSGGVWSNISGATSSSYTDPNADSPSDNTQYRVVVTNAYGTITSSSATVTVTVTPPSAFAGPTTVGPQAVVTDATLGPHSNVTGSLVNMGSADILFTANNQVISLVKTTGRVKTNGFTNVTLRNSDVGGVQTDPTTTMTVEWCRIGALLGRDKLLATPCDGPAHNAAHQYAAASKRNLVLRRCELYGTVDLINQVGGTMDVFNCWLHDGYQWALDPQQNLPGQPNCTDRSHTDGYQVTFLSPPTNITRFHFIENRCDLWVFRDDDVAGTAALWSDPVPVGSGWYLNSDPIRRFTAGFIFNLGNGTMTMSNVLIQGNKFDGNVYSWFNIGATFTKTAQLALPGTSGNIVIRDNFFKRRFNVTTNGAPHQTYYGSRALLDVPAGYSSKVYFYNNRDIDTNVVIVRPGVNAGAPP